MTTYNDVFGGSTIPPSQDRLNVISITADQTMYWPFEYSGEGISAADLIDITSDAIRTITFPAANSASLGSGFVIRNNGSYALIISDASGSTIGSISPGQSKYHYIENNSTAAGTWRIVTWGTGSSTAEASALVDAGLTVLSGRLATGIEVVESSASMSITSAHRSDLVVNTGGSVTFTLDEASTLGSEFYVVVRNSGSGTLTLATTSSQTIDGVLTIDIAPEETATIVRNGSSFYSFGQGRSTNFSFVQTNYITSATTVTVSSSEAGGYMLNFAGNPASAMTVTLPSVASIYYVYNNTSTTKDITFRTSGSGSTTVVPSGQRSILFCDSLNVVSAQSPATSGAVQFVDGSAANPAVTFSADPDTGFYRVGANTIGVTLNGVNIGNFDSTGWTGYVSGISPTILGYLSTLSSDVQVQIDSKEATGVAASLVTAHTSDTTDAHDASAISYLGSTDLIATDVESALDELDTEKQPKDATLTALSGALTAANKIPYATATDTLGELDFKDEDDMASNSATAVPSQQSTKAYADTKNIATQVPPGTSGNVLTSNGTIWTSAANSSQFSNSYISPTPTTYTATLILTESHGLSSIPKLVRVVMRCVDVSGDAGYSHNDEVDLSSYDSPGFIAMSIWSSSTQVGVAINGTVRVVNKSTGAITSITTTKWKILLMAWN